MAKKDTILTAEATIAQRDGLREIEAAGMGRILANVPEGWWFLGVREG